MPLDPTTLGTPVAVSAIGKELKKLWQADQTRTRASLINFAILCQGEDAMQENTALLAHFVENHAFRAVLIGVDAAPGDTSVQAWVNAHCYLPKAGAKHVCCEQVSLFIRGNVRPLLPNLLFSQLDYDLPLTLWWRCESSEHLNHEIWRWVDRLVFDSRDWRQPRQQLAALRTSLGTSRAVLCDLNWTRTLHLRQSLAQMFDTPIAAAALRHLSQVHITHAPGARTTAILLLGWLAAQLGWAARGTSGDALRFTSGTSDIACRLREEAGPSISHLELQSPALTVTASRPPGASFLNVQVLAANGTPSEHIMPADRDDTVSILDQEMASWGRHSVYLKALAAAEPLL